MSARLEGRAPRPEHPCSRLLVLGAIGAGLFLASLSTLFASYHFRADPGGLRLRLGPCRRFIPWSDARRLLIRMHRDGHITFQLIGDAGRLR